MNSRGRGAIAAPLLALALALGAAGCRRAAQVGLVGRLATVSGPSFMALSPEGDRLAVSCGLAQQVLVFDLKKPSLPPESIPADKDPAGLAFGPDGRLYACEIGSDQVAELSLEVGRVIRRTRSESGPERIAFSSDGAHFFVSCTGGAGVEAFFP